MEEKRNTRYEWEWMSEWLEERKKEISLLNIRMDAWPSPKGRECLLTQLSVCISIVTRPKRTSFDEELSSSSRGRKYFYYLCVLGSQLADGRRPTTIRPLAILTLLYISLFLSFSSPGGIFSSHSILCHAMLPDERVWFLRRWQEQLLESVGFLRPLTPESSWHFRQTLSPSGNGCLYSFYFVEAKWGGSMTALLLLPALIWASSKMNGRMDVEWMDWSVEGWKKGNIARLR